jgi:hypothetical protein
LGVSAFFFFFFVWSFFFSSSSKSDKSEAASKASSAELSAETAPYSWGYWLKAGLELSRDPQYWEALGC